MPNKIEKLADGHYLAEGELGEHFTGSADEIIPTILDAQQNTKRAYQQEKAARATAEQRAAQLEQELAASKQPPPVAQTSGQLTQQEMSMDDYFDDVKARRLGLKGKEELRVLEAAAFHGALAGNKDRVMLNFHNKYPDFPATDEASEILLKRVSKEFNIPADQIDDFTMKFPDVAEKYFGAAHLFSIHDGNYKGISEEEQKAANRDAEAINQQRNPAPPMLRTSNPELTSGSGQLSYGQLLNLPSAELRKMAIAQELDKK